MSKLEHYITCTVSQEDTHAARQQSSVEAFEAIRLNDILGSLQIAVTNTCSLCLRQVLHHFKRPNEPVGKHRGTARSCELA